MADIHPRRNKKGELISFGIRVYHGYDRFGNRIKPSCTTFKANPEWSEKKNRTECEKFANRFEEQCKMGFNLTHGITFSEYADYVIRLKESTGVKHTTILSYRGLLKRINPGIGHLKITEIHPQQLNDLYRQLGKEGLRREGGKAVAKKDLREILNQMGITFADFAKNAKISVNTLAKAVHGEIVAERIANSISREMGVKTETLFNIEKNKKPLSNKTILEHHRFISVVFNQAEKEMLVQYNPAERATPPRIEQKEANYFEAEDILKISECLEKEPIKWRTAVHLLLITGARRGEILGLKWDKIEWDENQIHIDNNLLYCCDRGIYEDSPKTKQSKRYIKLPQETMALLKKYKEWYDEQAQIWGSLWKNTGFVFVQEDGSPMDPSSLTNYCGTFSKKYGLPHINPHAFRHTMVSLLYYNGVDPITISKRLGHSKVSTTTDKYGHIMARADEAAAECIANFVIQRKEDQ